MLTHHVAVLHPEHKLSYFENHWGDELTVRVTQTVQRIVSPGFICLLFHVTTPAV
jgi:hypothetical protein